MSLLKRIFGGGRPEPARREFILQNDRFNKFWTIEVTGSLLITTYGRIGGVPRETRKELASEDAARREQDRLVASKLAEGYVEGPVADAPAYVKPDWAGMRMSEDVFWRIIGLLNWKKTGDDEAVIAPAVAALAQMGIEEITAFEDILAEKLYALDTEAHAREIGEYAWRPGEHFSVDWFLYARCVAVVNGRAHYEKVLANPSEMLKDMEFEAVLSIAPDAYERKTGRPFEHDSPVSYETFSNREGWRRANPV